MSSILSVESMRIGGESSCPGLDECGQMEVSGKRSSRVGRREVEWDRLATTGATEGGAWHWVSAEGRVRRRIAKRGQYEVRW